MDDSGATIRCCRKYLDRHFHAARIVAFVRTFGGEVFQSSDSLRSADSLNVFVEDGLDRGRLRDRKLLNFVRIFERFAVLQRQAGRNFGFRVTSMARVTSDQGLSAKIRTVQVV